MSTEEDRKEAEERIANNFGCGFEIFIQMHTADAFLALSDPGKVREIIGFIIDARENLQEEIDYTLVVRRTY
jgi:hypothetical protein